MACCKLAALRDQLARILDACPTVTQVPAAVPAPASATLKHRNGVACRASESPQVRVDIARFEQFCIYIMHSLQSSTLHISEPGLQTRRVSTRICNQGFTVHTVHQ